MVEMPFRSLRPLVLKIIQFYNSYTHAGLFTTLACILRVAMLGVTVHGMGLLP